MAPPRLPTMFTRAGGYRRHQPRHLRLLQGPNPDMARPIEGRYLYYAGWVAGTLSYHGLDFEVIVDEYGNPTNGLKLRGGPGNIEFSILVPEPPEQWPQAPSMPHQ
jgi:hypothetical protein